MSVAAAVCFSMLGPGDPDPDRPDRAPLAELVDGLVYARGNRPVRVVLGTAIVVTMVAFPYITFLPSVSEDFFDAGPEGFALLTLVGAVGGVLSGFVVARAVLRQGPLVQLMAGCGIGLALVGLGVAPTFPMALAASFVTGLATAAFQSMNATMALGFSDPAFHGRMQSLLQLGFSAFGLFSLVLGLVADRWGLRETLVAMGLTTIAVMVTTELLWRRGSDPFSSARG
jgi:MFS family permease